MNYAKVKFNESLIDHFSNKKLSSDYLNEIYKELLTGNYFEKNIYTTLKFLESKHTAIIGVNDYGEFKASCIVNIANDVPYDMLYALNQENLLEVIDNELKLDVDELKTALIIKHYGEEDRSILGIDVDKVNHITKLYDIDSDGSIEEKEFKLSNLKINYETASLETPTINQRQVEYSELGL